MIDRRRDHHNDRRGPCPDAFFFRNADYEARYRLPLCGNLHILSPVADDEPALKCASKIADQLCWPEQIPGEVCMPMWQDPDYGWPYVTPMLAEIRRRLTAAPVVFVCMMEKTPQESHFVYEVRPCEVADALNAALADGLIFLLTTSHSLMEMNHGHTQYRAGT